MHASALGDLPVLFVRGPSVINVASREFVHYILFIDKGSIPA
jgi:hypothetical protein